MRSTIIGRAMRIQFTNESTANQEFKMRVLLSAILWFSMSVCIMATDFEMGARLPGDYLIDNTTWDMSQVPSERSTFIMNILDASGKTINYIKIYNLRNDELNYSNIGNSSETGIVSLTITGSPGAGLNIRREVYIIQLNKITTSIPIFISVPPTTQANAAEMIATTEESVITEEPAIIEKATNIFTFYISKIDINT